MIGDSDEFFTREVGRGSKAQEEGFIFLVMFCTSSEETLGKPFRGWEMRYVGGTVWVEGPERAERMRAIFDVKKSMICCNSVVPISWGGEKIVWRLERSCLEYPGLLMMALE